MDHAAPPPPAAGELRSRGSKALLWLFIFAYVPFLVAHGIECWTQPAVDFPPLYSATKNVFDQHASPYGEDAFQEQALALGRAVPPFIYPPPSLLVLFPLHWFSYDTAKALMLVASHLCYLAAIALLFRRLFRDEFARAPTQMTAALVLIYLLLFDPAVVTLHLGQVNLFLLVCITWMWIALRRSGSALAVAIPLTLAIIIKTYPALLVALLVFRKRPKAAGYTVALFALTCAASYFLLPDGIWSDWLTNVMPAGDNAHAGPWNQNIRAFVARAFLPNGFSDPLFPAPSLAKPLIYLLSLAVALPTFWASFRCWRLADSARQIDFQMSLYLLMIFLIAPVSWEHHFVYLVPTLVLLIVMLVNGEVHGPWRWILPLALCLIAWRLPIAAPWLTKGFATLAISAKFYPAVALWIFFLTRTWQLGSESPALERQTA